MEIGRIGIWTNQFDQVRLSSALRAAAELEQLGYSALWLGELFGREALTQATLMLSATSTITVATGVASIHGRDATLMVQAQRTLHEAYGPRFLLGLGVGHPWTVSEMRGLPFGPRLPTMRAYLDRLDEVSFGPPNAEKRPPRVLGAVGPKMLGLAASHADGALPMGMPVGHTRMARALMGPAAFLAVVLPVLPADRTGVGERGEDRAAARQYVVEALPNRAEMLRSLGYDLSAGPDGLVDDLVARGGVDEIGQRVREHLDAGADHVCLSVIGALPGELPLRQWRTLAALTA
ncbi:TIGR03620 family F420-dependent LLM class oxidoreductase [Winogradskya consettensis]|uniref:LLM class F420-dependent oxidoreductase n=1 Tax=Winogradskya consettensis TaxID=113560 RepID=A0A919VUU9_9ACTN|nr:LLM class flavin-dependent oxidoreductase [Actinoplanes consettensis]GIM77576.1 LLM class F420-dependent oxidoreductase [Actinoplanes consettensis]